VQRHARDFRTRVAGLEFSDIPDAMLASPKSPIRSILVSGDLVY